MPETILHHYDLSPFSEKIRLALGVKKCAWRSVDIPIWPPRPDTVPLTAGYRRAPVLQIGADVYCDTMLILAELERRFPKPTLYPHKRRGEVQALSWWADTSMFMCAATLTTSIIGEGVPQEFIDDRIRFMNHDFSKEASLRALPQNRQRIAAAMTMLADMLKDQSFLFGEDVSAADLSAYHPLWFTKANAGEAATSPLHFGPLDAWMDRIAAIGHGERTEMSPSEALEIARAATPDDTAVAESDPSGLEAGAAVHVLADEPNDAIAGEFLGANEREIVIAHDSERAGLVHVHFPRFGYSVVAGSRDETIERSA